MGYDDNETRSLAMQIVGKNMKREGLEQQLAILKQVIEKPEEFRQHPLLSPVALRLLGDKEKKYHFEDKPYEIYGADGIEDGAIQQMKQAMSLPVTVGGALMPDAHQGYGLPIGGVLVTENAIIPYAVGVDIGCRMCLSIFDAKKEFLQSNAEQLKKILKDNSRFGFDTFTDRQRDDDFFDRPEFKELHIAKFLKDKAYAQIGSSGGGNHFVEFGVVVISSDNNPLKLPPGEYLALLSHSGSRGFGARIAQHYTRIASHKRKLPKHVEHLAWLHLHEEEGLEYWTAMNLAGDYASANHHHIHKRMSKALGMNALLRIENHHNFAWKETLPDGREVFVHRKGATPAGLDELGIIPGSMTAPAFVVRGLGNDKSLKSASHGAGRVMSRRKAMESINGEMLRQELKNKGVELIGGGVDESPFVYKNIHEVMQAQQDLVEVLAAFYPRIVRMGNDEDEKTI